jgi:hypothetical protein
MERSEIRGGIDASWLSRITLRSIRATHLKDHAKIAFCESFPRFLIDFRLQSYRMPKPHDPTSRGNKAVASMTYKDTASPIQRPHLTTVAASF